MRAGILTARLLAILFVASQTVCGEAGAPIQTGFDGTALDRELSRSVAELRRQGPEAVRFYVEGLAQYYAALERAQGVSPGDRRALSDRILARVAEVGFVPRGGDGVATGDVKPGGRGNGAARGVAWEGTVGFLGEHSFLVIGLLGGLVIAFALGSLAGYRRGASQASYYGAGDPRLWFVPVAADERKRSAEYPGRITLEEIQRTLVSGRTVLLQLGYDVSPRRRREFLRLMREMQRALGEVEGQFHSVWEDPKHPNRFYEIVVCDSRESLDLLMGDRSELAGLAARIEACWVPGRPVVRRTWWGVLPRRSLKPSRVPLIPVASQTREDVVL